MYFLPFSFLVFQRAKDQIKAAADVRWVQSYISHIIY
jgi:hypothetical protein